MICDLQDDGTDLVTKLPNFSSIKCGLYNARNKSFGVFKLHYFNSPAEVSVPKKFENNLLADFQPHHQ